MSALVQDLRHSVRLLLKAPGFTLTAIVVLALGIGTNAAVFSLVNGLLLRPLVGSQAPGQLVGVYSQDRTRPDSYRGFSYPAYTDIRDKASVFSNVGAFNLALAGLGEGDATRRAFVAVVSRNYFSTFGVGLLAGRSFTAQEDRPDSNAAVAVVSYPLWKRHGSDGALLGKTIRINARSFTVVGIAPPGFTGSSVGVAPEAWVPIGADALVSNDFMRDAGPSSLADRRSTSLMLVGRLRPGLTVDAAKAPLDLLSRQLERAYPGENRNQLLITAPLARLSISTSPQDDGDMFGVLGIIMAMAAIVLLIACLNLANMMLARGTARRKEMAMRLALGGGRLRIVRQLVTEGLLLSLLGGAGGLVAGYWGVSALVSSLAAYSPVPLTFDASPDVRVVAAVLLFSALATILFSLGPAWKLARTSIVPELKEHAGEDGRRGRWFGARNLLVGSQIALSLGLLTTAGLFMRGALKAGDTDPGYRYDNQVMASLDTSLAGYDETRAREAYGRLMDRLRVLPGVRSASMASCVAFGGYSEGPTIQRVGAQGPAGGNQGRAGKRALSYSVGTDYFQTLGIAILQGRGFSAAEERDPAAPRVAVIDEPLAQALFPGENPIGQYIRRAPREEAQPGAEFGTVASPAESADAMEVVGIVRGLRHDMFDRAPVPHIYLPYARAFRSQLYLHLRLASGDRAAEEAMMQAVRQEIRRVDERLPVLALKTMAEFRDTSLLYWVVKAGASLFTVFGSVAVLLAVIGLYAVRAYIVARRTREIGIRMALGASPGGVVRLVLKEGAGLTLAGLGLGFLLAVGIGRVVSSLLYEVNPFDPIVFAAAPLLLAVAALAACYLPARRATRVVPVVALRSE